MREILKTEQLDVLVVVAGPTGLMTAGELARRGVRVRLIGLFAYARMRQLAADRVRLRAIMEVVDADYPESIRSYWIVDEGVSEENGIDNPVVIDIRSEFRRYVGVEHGDIILARPDGYIAFCCSDFGSDHVKTLLEKWVLPTSRQRLLSQLR